MIFVSVYTNRVATDVANAEYVKAFADGTSAEAIATELFNHAEFEKASPGFADPGEVHANLVSTVAMALQSHVAVTINAERRLVISVEPQGVQIGSL